MQLNTNQRDTLAGGEKEHDRRSAISCELELGTSLLLGTWHRANAPCVWEDESFNYNSYWVLFQCKYLTCIMHPDSPPFLFPCPPPMSSCSAVSTAIPNLWISLCALWPDLFMAWNDNIQARSSVWIGHILPNRLFGLRQAEQRWQWGTWSSSFRAPWLTGCAACSLLIEGCL